MGVASSKATAAPGPELTFSEKTAADDADIDAWLKQLEDRSNPVRLNVAHLLSLSVYASDMGTNYNYLKEHLLQICSRSRQRRAKMLQTPFLNGETLITWTICHLPERLLLDTPFDRIPPVLRVQLECIKSWEANATLTDAMSVACCIRNANRLFQLLNPYRKSRSSGSLLYTLRQDATSKTFQFTIDDFPTLMLVEGRVDLRFICESRLYSIGFLIGRRGEWSFFYHVVQDRSGERYTKTIHVDLETFRGSIKKQSVFKAQVSSSDWLGGEWPGGDASMLKNA